MSSSCGRLYLVIATLLLFLQSSPAKAERISVYWKNENILMEELNGDVPLHSPHLSKLKKAKSIACSFFGRRTNCYQLFSLSALDRSRHYGKNLRFVKPIPVLPWPNSMPAFYLPQGDPEEWLKRGDESYVRQLPLWTDVDSAEFDFDAVPNEYAKLALGFPDVSFTAIDVSNGGRHALEVWRLLLGKRPTRQCAGGDDYCSIVLSAKRNGEEALVYCGLANIKREGFGLGLPFNCETVAYQSHGQWLVLTFEGPFEEEGGAISGAKCFIYSKQAPSDIEPLVIAAFKKGKTNIDLFEVEKTQSSIELAGKKERVNSQFYSGYFEQSSADYHIAKIDIDGKPALEIGGLFNLLISADGESNNSYRQIDDIPWFQNQVLKIIKEQIGKKISDHVECSSYPIQ